MTRWLTLAVLILTNVASAAELVRPNGLAVDAGGNLFISDVATHRILKLDREGKLSVVAGTGEGGFSGDGGPAATAKLNSPMDLAIDGEGRLLIADTFNHRIRRIDAKGLIATVGEGFNNPQSVAVGKDGDLFVADTYNHVVKRVDRDGKVSVFAGTEAGLAGDKGPAVKAQINLPQAVAVGPDGAAYISDAANSRIRKVSADGIIVTICGSGPGSGEGGAGFAGDGGPPEKAKLFSPADIEFDSEGRLWISDSGNNRLRVVEKGLIRTVAGNGKPGLGGDGGKATDATMNTPRKIAVANDGSVFIADRVNGRVRKVDREGVMTTVAGKGAEAR
jgi:sugar lactone lactonase YvrE